MPDKPHHDVFEDLRRVAQKFGVEQLAAMMGMSPGTLYNKLNLNENTANHKINLADYIQIIAFTRQVSPHQALSRMLGMAAFVLPDMSEKSDEALLDIINRIHIEGGHVHQEVAHTISAPVVSRQQAKRISVEVYEWISAILELDARISGMVSDGVKQ